MKYIEEYDRATVREIPYQLKRIADTLEIIAKDIKELNERV